MKKSNTGWGLFWLVAIVAIIVAAFVMGGTESSKPINYAKVSEYFHDEQVVEFTVSKTNKLTMKLKNGETVSHNLRDLSIFYYDFSELIEEQHSSGIIKTFEYEAPTPTPAWLKFMPIILVVIVMIVLWWLFFARMNSSNSSGGGMGGIGRMNSFSKSRAKLGSDESKKVLFTDVAGADEEKEELREVVEFLKNPKKFSSLGARIPKGVLLVGAPGTGKTLLAKAVAGESSVPFYSLSGSDFVELYVGVGASRVRDLFETAKKTAPCIIFIDEIDAVGRHRGAGWGGGHDEREQTLNQLLVEMDGFGVNDGVIVIAATNRPDILDPALLRPGRFDRQVTVSYPDIKGRTEILAVHARNKPLSDDVDLETIAKSTPGFTGADLSNLLNEAALLAARKGEAVISMEDIEEASIKVIVGTQKRSRIIKPEEKRKTAIHEAGHAIISRVLNPDDFVRQISVIPSGSALGYTLSLPKEDRWSVYRGELQNKISELLGGRVAEELCCDDISGGASNDIQRATEIARKMVTTYGMSDKLGPIVFGTGHDEVFLGKDYSTQRNYSEEIASEIDAEIHRIITEAHDKAKKILAENMDKLNLIVEYLVAYEIMDEEQFNAVFEENCSLEILEKMRDEKTERIRVANEKRREELRANEENKEDPEDSDKNEDVIPH
ncbi:MAG: ATP-dependent zinc metalloprotease FtsH [Ruminococcaceae bacterium]|nr:ATP-dependent zinc metalloprotease FtsH [Oscillospiraceae bacterium]MBQ3598460.1 ATP-dependent zinc metalloprotease FtsH [Clostridia bacterium]MBR2915301.1 ATP-dependent zinc metalloprotease FtsH [Clostridia bacterium]